eukprot:12351004-Alexandrium_andersonii.AAC.2
MRNSGKGLSRFYLWALLAAEAGCPVQHLRKDLYYKELVGLAENGQRSRGRLARVGADELADEPARKTARRPGGQRPKPQARRARVANLEAGADSSSCDSSASLSDDSAASQASHVARSSASSSSSTSSKSSAEAFV